MDESKLEIAEVLNQLVNVTGPVWFSLSGIVSVTVISTGDGVIGNGVNGGGLISTVMVVTR